MQALGGSIQLKNGEAGAIVHLELNRHARQGDV